MHLSKEVLLIYKTQIRNRALKEQRERQILLSNYMSASVPIKISFTLQGLRFHLHHDSFPQLSMETPQHCTPFLCIELISLRLKLSHQIKNRVAVIQKKECWALPPPSFVTSGGSFHLFEVVFSSEKCQLPLSNRKSKR